MVAVQDSNLARTYAWWLTGDTETAETAARRALGQLALDDREATLLNLLLAVRKEAIITRTMCPASELALLVDGHGLELNAAATVAEVDPADARQELAHGRLEALQRTVREPFEHPERLGGLAVGNPPDVAHARACPTCAIGRDLLVQGRLELRHLTAAGPPGIALAPPSDPTPAGSAPAAHATVAQDPEAPAAVVGPVRSPEFPIPSHERANRHWWLVAVASVVTVIVLSAVLARLGVDARTQPVPDPTAVAPPVATDPAPTSPTVEPAPVEQETVADATEPLEQGFRVVGAGLVLADETVPVGSGAVIDRFDPIRLAVAFQGAAGGVVLTGDWTVDGEALRELRVVLSSREGTHTFSSPIPADGWPPGQHRVAFEVDGELVASVQFTVL